MPLNLAWKTDPGLQRQENEDSVLVWEGRAGVDALLIVCDGMGGHAAGREASTIAIEAMASRLDSDGAAGGARERLVAAFEEANRAVLESARAVPEWAGMGSTLTAVLIAGDHLALLNVGDSPAYVIRDGEVFPISQDHSWPAEQFRAGRIEAWEVKDHPFKHRLTRAVGVWDDVQPYTAEIELENGDLVVIASDGIETAGIETDVVRDHLLRDDLESGVADLVELSRAYGAPDNVTVAVARYAGAEPEPAAVSARLDRVSKKKKASKRRK